MNEITSELHNEVLEKFRPMVERLAEEGKTPQEITAIYVKYLKTCQKNYYGTLNSPQPFRDIYNKITIKTDSTAELILYNFLQKHGIEFEFQKKIGIYRIDYLVDNFLVVELDGDYHDQKHDDIRDKYLERMGYRVLRIALNDLMVAPELLIAKIKEQQPKAIKKRHIRLIK